MIVKDIVYFPCHFKSQQEVLKAFTKINVTLQLLKRWTKSGHKPRFHCGLLYGLTQYHTGEGDPFRGFGLCPLSPESSVGCAMWWQKFLYEKSIVEAHFQNVDAKVTKKWSAPV